MSNNAYLTGKLPQKDRQTWALLEDETLIGRHPSTHVSLPLPSISRRHAKITTTPQGYFIEDLGSRNGTFLNGEEVGTEPRLLKTGDKIVLGGEITLAFSDPYETIDGKMIGRVDGIWIDPKTEAVWANAKLVEPPLSTAQYALLSLLYEEEGKALSYQQIITQVWDDVDSAGVSKDAVNGVVKRLRARLKEIQPDKNYIETLRGYGFRLSQEN